MSIFKTIAMKKNYILLFCFFSSITFAQVSGIGIGTSNPQQVLHLAGATGTVKVDGLNATNNTFNGGGVDKTYPLYVDGNGDLTLALATFQNSDGTDALTTSTPLIATTLTELTTSTPAGVQRLQILPITVTVNRAAVLEIKYSISFDVLATAVTKIRDQYARRVSNYYTLDDNTATARRYGQASKCYYNFNQDLLTPNAAQGTMFNSSTTYVNLTAGTHTIRLYGELATGTSSRATVVNFAVDQDSVFMRLY